MNAGAVKWTMNGMLAVSLAWKGGAKRCKCNSNFPYCQDAPPCWRGILTYNVTILSGIIIWFSLYFSSFWQALLLLFWLLLPQSLFSGCPSPGLGMQSVP